MIGFLSGRPAFFEDDVCTLVVEGIGYEVHSSEENAWYWIHEVAPQDAPHELYGFKEREERDLFRRLLEVQGVGPKVAQRIVANKGVSESKDGSGKLISVESTLRAIRGVGPKLAQRISEAFQ